MIRIAQASSSENFGKYGIAPNQRRTGASRTKPEGNLDGELNVVEWYGGWEKVYRPIDAGVAERLATFMYRAVSNGNYVGYSWSGNTELWDALHAKNTTDPLDIDTYVNCDCTTLLGAGIDAAGIHDSGLRALVTWRVAEVLGRTNAFSVLTSKEMLEHGKGIRRGDILWKEGHVAVALDSDPIDTHVSLTDKGLYFTDSNSKTIGEYPSNVKMSDLLFYQKFAFNGVKITAGTSGTRAVQRTVYAAKDGYKILDVRLHYVSNSALCKVDPFFGWADEDRLSVNFYRASGASGTIDATVMVIYVRNEVVKTAW